MAKRLTSAFVRNAKAGKYGDEHGLILVVKPTGSRHWVQRIMIRGKRRDLGLGGYPLVSLAEARDRAFMNRKVARDGGDPIALRKSQEVPTFADAAETVIQMHEPSWKDADSAQRWRATLRDYVFPRLGCRRVDDITPSDVMAVLQPIWLERHVTAKRVRQRIGAIMKWAIAKGYRQDNPAGDAIAAALPKVRKPAKHHQALPYAEVGQALAVVRGSDAAPSIRLALEFLVLTATRSGEVRLATWDEIDVDGATWTIPGERMKAKREHRVPLSPRAIEVLEEAKLLRDRSGLIFPSPTGRTLHDGKLSGLLKALGVGAVPHGFRSSFRDWAAEQTDAPHAVMEAALAHVIKDKAEAAYARTDLFERRRELMEAWAAFVGDGG